MKRSFLVVAVSLGVAVLAGCGEKDQSLSSSYNKSDGKPWQGAHDPYLAKGWTPGDKTAWENQIRTRNQTQNEYAKVN